MRETPEWVNPMCELSLLGLTWAILIAAALWPKGPKGG